MKLTTLARGKPHLIFAGLLLVITACAAAALSANDLSTAVTAQADAALRGVQDELQIQLDGNGFAPAEVQHVAGTFAILVENSNVSGEYMLRLKNTDGALIKEVQVQKGSSAWTVTLSAGEYMLTEVSHPQWLCRITVQ